MRSRALLAFLALSLAAQDLVVNHLGGAANTGGGFGGLVTARAAIGVSPDGKLLYVTQASQGIVLRYDLRARTMERIAVPGLAEGPLFYPTSQSVTSIAVNDDGTALIPVGRQIARIELDGKVTIPGFAFTPQNSAISPVELRAVAHPATNPGRNAILAIHGIQTGQSSFWAPSSATFDNPFGRLGNCASATCNNATLPANTPSGDFKGSLSWGLAIERFTLPNNAQGSVVYFTDSGGQYAANGGVAMLRSFTSLTVLGHPALAGIPAGTSGQRLSSPTGLVLDLSGNLLIADTGNHRILRRTPAGVWSVFAGTGTRGSRGDGRPATSAELFEPKSLAIDASGTVYVHDSGNGFLRRILPSGVMERINTNPDQAPPETLIQDLQLPSVTALATDSLGQLYVASQARIVKVDARGRATYIGGTGQYGRSGDGVVAADSPMNFTAGMTVDLEGRVVYSEPLRIRRIETSGIVNTIAGNGAQRPVDRTSNDPDPVPALSAYMFPTSVSTATDGSLLIVDGNWVRRLRDGQITSITGLPWCGGINDLGNKAFADGIPAIFACTGANAGFPHSVFATADGRIHFDDSGVSVRTIDSEGFVSTLANLQGLKIGSMAPGPDNSVYALVYRSVANQQTTTNSLLVRIAANGQVTRLSSDTRTAQLQPLRAGQGSTELVIYADGPIATDGRGFVYIWDSTTRRVVVFGEPVTVEVDSVPSGLSVTVDGTSVVTPRTFRWLPGDYHTVVADPKSNGVDFLGWSHALSPSVTWMPNGGASRVVASYGDAPAIRRAR